ncbi:hypothetical protein EDF74_1267 [Stenotrophomonas rhizophila]|nr:hypothetical protein EDF74_1267 [Stenotrophomonas rhizophila]
MEAGPGACNVVAAGHLRQDWPSRFWLPQRQASPTFVPRRKLQRMLFEHRLDARARLISLRVFALIQNFSSEHFELRPELRWMAHLRHPVDQHPGQRIELTLYLGTDVHPGGASKSRATL